MQDMPSPSAILDLAIAQLNADAPEARSKFETRMATAALALVKRAIELQPHADAQEMSRLRALLDEESADLEALNRRLCALIRSGELALTSAQLAEMPSTAPASGAGMT